MAGDLRLHGLQEDVLKGVSLGVEAADLDLPLGGDTIELADLHPFGQHELEALLAVDRHLAAEGFDGGGEGGLVAPPYLELEELAVRLALGFEVAVGGHPAVLEHQHLLAALLDVAQEMRGEYNVPLALVADVAHQLEHALAGRGVEAVGGLVEEDQPRTVDEGL